MVLNQNKTFLAYRCPHCGTGVMGICGSFALSGGRMLRLRCTCGESGMTVSETADKKLRLSVPCLLCNGEHSYLVSPTLFYGRELFLLNCAYSDLDICFIGEEERVRAALTENEERLRAMLAEAGLASLSHLHGQDDAPALPDTEVYDIIRFLVRELEADGEIDCPCGNGEYELEMTPGGVRVFCQNCGGEHVFRVDSVQAAQAFLSADHLTLTDPD